MSQEIPIQYANMQIWHKHCLPEEKSLDSNCVLLTQGAVFLLHNV